jgi:hypothetical protein
MPISANVVVRFNKLDKAALVELSERLQRNQSETLRVLVRETLAVLKEREAQQAQAAEPSPHPNQ